MADRSAIEWTDATWNSIRGCTRVSEGCRNCYAERQAARQAGPGGAYEGLVRLGTRRRSLESAKRGPLRGPTWTGEVRFVPKLLDLPLRWRKPRRIFVNSMSDLFHEKVEDEWIARIFAVMAEARRHVFQVLTKRPERMREILRERLLHYSASLDAAMASYGWPLPNVWLGVSVEDQATADARIPLLLQTPAAVRWVSYEPAIGPVDFKTRWLCPEQELDADYRPTHTRLSVLDWLVVGGESGPGARPFDLAWARSAIAQARAAGCKVFVKQVGAVPVVKGAEHAVWPPHVRFTPLSSCCTDRIHLRDRKGGSPEEWPKDLRIREWPAGAGRGRG